MGGHSQLHGFRRSQNLVARIGSDDIAHAAARRGQRHANGDDALTADQALDTTPVHQPQIDDVDRDFRIETGAQLIPDELLDLVIAGGFRQRRSWQCFKPQGIEIATLDQIQPPFVSNADRAAFRLHDTDDAIFCQRIRLAERNGNGFYITL